MYLYKVTVCNFILECLSFSSLDNKAMDAKLMVGYIKGVTTILIGNNETNENIIFLPRILDINLWQTRLRFK